MDPEKILRHAGKVFALMGGDVGNLSPQRASMSIAANMDRLGVMQILKDCFDLAQIEGKKLGNNDYWKTYFLGKPRELVRVIEFMVEVHFADFFGEIVQLVKERARQLQELLGSQVAAQE